MTEFKVDGNMTVQMLRKSFKETFGASLRVYKGSNSGRGARPADDNVQLKSLSGNSSLQNVGEFKVSDAITIGDFEDSFLATFGLAVQVASYDDSRLLDNDMILKPGKKPKIKGEKDEELPSVNVTVPKMETTQVLSHSQIKQSDNNNKIIIYAALVLILITIIGIYVFTGDKKNDVTKNIETSQVVETEDIAEVAKDANQDNVFDENYSDDINGEFDNSNQSLSQTTEKDIESIIKKIRAVFNETQSNLSKYKVDIIESDVEKLTAYFENGNVRLIQFEIYGQNRDNYYYDNNNFIFMFNDGKQVNRYYFSGKKMIRWLDPAKNMMSENDDNFKMNEELIYEKAESMLNQFLYK